MADSKAISIVLPIYNEEYSITSTLAALRTLLKKLNVTHEIICVNDCSTDNSKAILQKEKGITLVNNPYNLGYGASLKRGITKAKYDWIFITDVDGTYPIDRLPDLIKHMDDYDMIVGARTGKNVHVPFMRKPAKFILGQLAYTLTGIRIPDLNSGMRIFKKDIAMRYINLFPDGFSFTTTLTMICLTNGYKVKYIPINYYERIGTTTLRKFSSTIWTFRRIFLQEYY